MTSPAKPPRSVWVVIGDYSRWLAGRGDVAAARRAGYRVHRYDLHRPRKAKPRRSRRAKEVKRG